VLYCSHTPKNWSGYDGFKKDPYIPLRNWQVKSQSDTKDFILRFADGLAAISKHYANVISSTDSNTLSAEEHTWLTKIHHSANVANFLPLIVAARMHRENDRISEADYADCLKALECYAYRVFLHEAKRSNAGKSKLYSWAWDVFRKPGGIRNVTAGVYGLIEFYASEQAFLGRNANPMNWYSRRNLLRYTLFEYELHLLATEGKHKKPALAWKQLGDSTFEHILPQNPKENSHWKEVWNETDTGTYLHDIGNLVLTQNNSNYLNFEFMRKKGAPGISPSYCNSDIRQERKIASLDDWRPAELSTRRQDLVQWIAERWKTPATGTVPPADLNEQDDMDDAIDTRTSTATAGGSA
jgi:hypothetical protein